MNSFSMLIIHIKTFKLTTITMIIILKIKPDLYEVHT